ncbi:hypothetical protein I316_02731 [Kwoniella heveanensis BCC8398]|uniref:Uncharacterized protein n=1 Tax=Kwoniella heveanensis BCC8398 TaxID=1296120 RepID=A0A1B9GXB7_9TREE|nr:hypothetical protein I316_02731 [Kwoniella heveanensis BCC8398]
MAEPAFASPQSRHPFAYSAGPTLPFAALGQTQRGMQDDQRTEYLQSQRPESEVLSRGVGVAGLGQPNAAAPAGTETPGGFSATSPGMGTFGMELEPAQVPLPKSRLATTAVTGSPKKSAYTTRKAPPTATLPPEPTIRNEPAQPKPDSDEQLEVLEQPSAHDHKPHHDHPFSHAEAQAKQIQAMEEARAAALAQLEAAQRQSILQMEQEMLDTLNSANELPTGRQKGPRQTYDTMTSGPSFGHLLHQNGMPLSATQSMQVPPDGFDPRQITGMSDSFFRIPFGVPMGMSIPRPLLVMRDSAGAGLGLGLSPELLDILEEEVKPPRGPEDRSAFVETVEDLICLFVGLQEEGSGVRTDIRTESPSKAPTQGVRSTFQPDEVARTESGLLGEQPTAPRSVAQSVRKLKSLPSSFRARPSTHAPIAQRKSPSVAPKAPLVAPSKARTKTPTKAPTVMSEAFPRAPTQAPTVAGGQSQAPRAVSQHTFMEYPDGHTVYSQVRTKNTPTIIPNEVSEYFHGHPEAGEDGSIVPSNHGSVAPTTISNVKKLVAESRFHDETLCQLLDAARLNLIGDEAKKALQRAARARVIELRDSRERGEIEEGIATPVVPEAPKSRETTPKKDRRSRSRSRKRSASEKTELNFFFHQTVVAQDPPAWAQDIMSRLAAFDSRFSALEAQKHEVEAMQPGRPATHHSQVTQDIPSNLIDELIFNEMPSSGFTGGLNMPLGLTQSILFPEQGNMTPMPGYASQKAQTHYTTNKPVSTEPPPQSHYSHGPIPTGAASAHTARAPAVLPTQYSQRAPTQARSAAPTHVETTRGHVNPDIPTWGSEVELPQADSLPVPGGPTTAPTINILAPTEPSVAPGRMSTRAPSRPASQTGTTKAPDHVDVTVITEQALPETAVPDPKERDLPAPPSESERSHRPTPPSKSTPLDANTTPGRMPGAASIPLAQGSVGGGTVFPTQSAYVGNPDHYPPSLHGPPPGAQAPFGFAHPPVSAHAKSPSPQTRSSIHMQPHDIVLSPPQNPMSPPRDKIHVIDPLHPQMGGWKPWDMLTQRLYSWALIAEEKSFVRALEEVSLGRQVEEFPLSIFMMMTYKRLIRRNLSDNPPVPCDKLLVPPNLASAVNIAVHRRRYHEAKEILLELWDSLGSKEPPRVIISLAPLGNDPDQWAAHRYDTVTKHLTTYRVSHLDDIQTDGRSFWWWEAIGQAWPQLQIPDMDTLEYSGKQRIVNERRPPEHRHDNSLYAANVARNLLLGYRPERPQDLTKLRELVWAEVKRLLGKKRHGRLVVEPDLSEHLYDA